MSTISQPVVAPATTHRVLPLRTTTVLGLFGFPLAGALAAMVDAEEGTETAAGDLYSIAAAHADSILAAGLIFMVSAILTVPAAIALMQLTPERGRILGRVGGAFLVAGGFGHMGFATWQVMVSRIPHDPDRVALVSYLDRQQAVTTSVLLPLLISVVVGVLLLVIALHRAGVVPSWFLLTGIGMVAFDVVLNSTPVGESAVAVKLVWVSLALLFGYLGVRILRLGAIGTA